MPCFFFLSRCNPGLKSLSAGATSVVGLRFCFFSAAPARLPYSTPASPLKTIPSNSSENRRHSTTSPPAPKVERPTGLTCLYLTNSSNHGTPLRSFARDVHYAGWAGGDGASPRGVAAAARGRHRQHAGGNGDGLEAIRVERGGDGGKQPTAATADAGEFAAGLLTIRHQHRCFR